MRADFSIKGSIAVVTGGAGILCAEMAKGFSEHGVRIALLDIMQDRAQLVAD